MASAFLLCTYLVGRLLSTRLASEARLSSKGGGADVERGHSGSSLSRKWLDVEERARAQASEAGLEVNEIEWVAARARESATVAAGGGSGRGGGGGAVLVVRLPLLNELVEGLNSPWAMEPVAVQERLKLRLRLALAEVLSRNRSSISVGDRWVRGERGVRSLT